MSKQEFFANFSGTRTRTHNPKVAGSSPAPAIKKALFGCLFVLKVSGIRTRTHNSRVAGSSPNTAMFLLRSDVLAYHRHESLYMRLSRKWSKTFHSPATVTKYQKQISDPLFDRIDIHIEVPRVDYKKLSGNHLGESSESIRVRIQAARNVQLARFSKIESSNIIANADMRVGGSGRGVAIPPKADDWLSDYRQNC
jgi:hypothetical protein